MMNRKKIFRWLLVWFFALALTGAALVYQSLNSPARPKREQLWLSDDQQYNFKLPRSHGGNANCLIEISIPDANVGCELFFRRYAANEEWQQVTMVRVSDKLAAFLPVQPPAGKLEYYLKFNQGGKVFRIPNAENIIIMFRGDVPAAIALPHALLMFIAMLLSNLTLLLVIFRFSRFRLFAGITLASIIVGGLFFGPLVQKYAFGQYWTGFPVGMDLADNKTLVAVIFWGIAVAVNLKRERKFPVILASLVMLIVFSIPQSSMSSERDPESGKIKTGMLINPCNHLLTEINENSYDHRRI